MTYQDALRHHVLRCLHKDVEFPQDAVDVGERSIAFVMLGVPCSIDLHVPEAARVWAFAGRDVKPTLAVLRELNAWNERLHRAKVWLDEDRDVIVAAEVRTESLEPGELGDVVTSVVDCARRLRPVVDVVFGAPPTTPPNEEIDR